MFKSRHITNSAKLIKLSRWTVISVMVFQDQNERKAKQAYLRDEVINRGYDPELFAEFLDKNRIGGRTVLL